MSEIKITLKSDYLDFIESIKKEHKLLESDSQVSRFRVEGEFFSDMRAVEVVLGKEAKSKYYAKIGFNLDVYPIENNMVLLKAEERVIFGYFEIKAVSKSLALMLNNLNIVQ